MSWLTKIALAASQAAMNTFVSHNTGLMGSAKSTLGGIPGMGGAAKPLAQSGGLKSPLTNLANISNETIIGNTIGDTGEHMHRAVTSPIQPANWAQNSDALGAPQGGTR